MNEVNRRCIESLNRANLKDRVAVVGAGPSTAVMASVGDLCSRLKDMCGLEKAQGQHLWDYCEAAHAQNPDAYFTTIKESYGTLRHATARAYDHIVKMGFKGFVTFNYDDQLPHAFRQAFGNVDRRFTVYPPMIGRTHFAALQLFSSIPRLLAIHGYADNDNPNWHKEVILRRSDYNTHYINPPSTLVQWWTDFLLAGPALFIGTSLFEPGLSRVVQSIIIDERDRLDNTNHFHLLPHPESETRSDEGEVLSFGVFRQIYYDPLDAMHSGLLEVLSPFSQLPIDRPSPRFEAPAPIQVDDTFSFYHQ